MTGAGDTSGPAAAAEAAVAAAFRTEWGRLVATLIGWAGDWDLAEEGAQEAFLQAWRHWPGDGVPDRPGAWLLTAARRRVLDRLRHRRTGERTLRELAMIESTGPQDPDAALDPALDPAQQGGVQDDRLRLIFTCCHPALAFHAQVALALRTLTGLTTVEIAGAFGVPEATMAKRLVRAKQKIADAGIPYRVPPAHLLPERTRAVLGVVYLLFNEGHLATGGSRLDRPDLTAEALRLATVLVELMPDDPEARGLRSLLLLQQARSDTRTSPAGDLVPLPDQDRGRWDRALIDAGLSELRRAAARERLGPYQLQAMIAACHLTAPTAAATDWARIVQLYDALQAQVPSRTVALNRAVAIAMRSGPAAGLAQIDTLERAGGLPPGHLVPAVRADLLRRQGRVGAAAVAYRQAIDRTVNDAERGYLHRRLTELAPGPAAPGEAGASS